MLQFIWIYFLSFQLSLSRSKGGTRKSPAMMSVVLAPIWMRLLGTRHDRYSPRCASVRLRITGTGIAT